MSDQMTYTLEQARYAAEQRMDEAWLRFRSLIIQSAMRETQSLADARDELDSAIEGMTQVLDVIRKTEFSVVKMLENAKVHKS